MDLSQWIEDNRSMFTSLSDGIWGYAELGYKEFKSSKTLEDALEEAGFTLERGVAEIPTAFVASYSKGKGFFPKSKASTVPRVDFSVALDALSYSRERSRS